MDDRKLISRQQETHIKKKQKIERVVTDIIYRERRKTMTGTLATEVTTKTARLNPEQIDLSKMIIKNGPDWLKVRMRKDRKISD